MKPQRKSSGKSLASNQIRIIGGDFRRRQLQFPDGEGLRPTPDRVRETLFNWLGQALHGQHCLDLFAGSGALGFEAASRGAARVIMIERNRATSEALKSNRALLGANTVEIIPGDALAWLDHAHEKFDVIFLDPPFASDLLAQAMTKLPRIVDADTYVYVECAKLPDLEGWSIEREGKAGLVHYLLLRRRDPVPDKP